ncbi:kinesin-like protein Klp8, partial [Blyttiomyces sp. JEL0837]
LTPSSDYNSKPTANKLPSPSRELSTITVAKKTTWSAIDTKLSYVRGEENLGSWIPKGQEAIVDFVKARSKRELLGAVEGSRQRAEEVFGPIAGGGSSFQQLSGRGAVGLFNGTSIEQSSPTKTDHLDLETETEDYSQDLAVGTKDNILLLRKVVDYWRRPTVQPGMEQLLFDVSPTNELNTDDEESVKWVEAEIQEVNQKSPPSWKGFLMTPDDADVWIKRFFVLRRPCLYMYETAAETEEIAVFGLTTVSVQSGPELGSLFQASTEDEMNSWISALDPLQVAARLSKMHGSSTSLL